MRGGRIVALLPWSMAQPLCLEPFRDDMPGPLYHESPLSVSRYGHKRFGLLLETLGRHGGLRVCV